MNKRKIDLEAIAKGTPGMVGADLENIVNEAALLAASKPVAVSFLRSTKKMENQTCTYKYK